MNLGGTNAATQAAQEVQPELDEVVCGVLGGPIKYSRNDTKETVDQITVLHNSQWKEFNCGKR